MVPEQNPPSLTIVYPMFNEVETVDELLGEAVSFLSEHYPDYEIVAVDDASTDGTGKMLDRAAAQNPRIKVLHHDRNRRLGGALRTGFAAATKSLVLYSDADFPFDLEDVHRGIRAIRRADIVSAYRHDRHSEGWWRTLQSFIYNLLVTLVYGLHLRDVNFAYKLFRLDALRRIDPKSEGSFIDAEILIRALRQNMRVVQIGVDYFPRSRGSSTLTSMPVVFRLLVEMVKLFPELRRLKKQARRPAPVAAEAEDPSAAKDEDQLQP